MGFGKTVLGVGAGAALIAGGVYAANNVEIGCLADPTECVPDWNLFEGGEPSADATVYGPEIIDQRVIDKRVAIQMGEIALTLRFPRGPNGETSRMRYDNGKGILGWDPIGDGYREILDTPFQVNVIPCVVTGKDYETVSFDPQPRALGVPGAEVAGAVSKPADADATSYVDVIEENGNPASPYEVTGLEILSTGLEVCAAYMPTHTADGQPNILRKNNNTPLMGGIPELEAESFDWAANDLAVSKAESDACLEEMVNQTAAKQRVAEAVVGQIVLNDPTYLTRNPAVARNITVSFSDPGELRKKRQEAHLARLETYRQMTETVNADGNGRRRPISFEFADSVVEVTSCQNVA